MMSRSLAYQGVTWFDAVIFIFLKSQKMLTTHSHVPMKSVRAGDRKNLGKSLWFPGLETL